MIKDGVYHRDIGFPAPFVNPFLGRIQLLLTKHAKQARHTDRYSRHSNIGIESGDVIELSHGHIVELQFEAGEPVKAVVRLPFVGVNDLVLVLLAPRSGISLVKTLWLNRNEDTHRTLDRSKYVKPV